jgi:hypothetical protein
MRLLLTALAAAAALQGCAIVPYDYRYGYYGDRHHSRGDSRYHRHNDRWD